jgi:hypothetical protein
MINGEIAKEGTYNLLKVKVRPWGPMWMQAYII